MVCFKYRINILNIELLLFFIVKCEMLVFTLASSAQEVMFFWVRVLV